MFTHWFNRIHLIFIRFIFEFRIFFDHLRNIYKYYSNPLFRKVDLLLLKSYSNENPYQINKIFLANRGEVEIHKYGETLLYTAELIALHASLSRKDTIYELGCGRGRLCFWFAIFLKAKVVGIDYVPQYIKKAKNIAKQFQVNGVSFYCEDFLKIHFQDVTAIYLNGILMEDQEILILIQKLICLPKGIKLITVSFSFLDYPYAKHWKLITSFQGLFSWGKATIYVQELL